MRSQIPVATTSDTSSGAASSARPADSTCPRRPCRSRSSTATHSTTAVIPATAKETRLRRRHHPSRLAGSSIPAYMRIQSRLSKRAHIAHLGRSWQLTGEVESLSLKQPPGGHVLGAGDGRDVADLRHCPQPSKERAHRGGSDSLASRRGSEAVTDLDAAVAVWRAVGPEVPENPSVRVTDHQPDGRQDSCN